MSDRNGFNFSNGSQNRKFGQQGFRNGQSTESIGGNMDFLKEIQEETKKFGGMQATNRRGVANICSFFQEEIIKSEPTDDMCEWVESQILTSPHKTMVLVSWMFSYSLSDIEQVNKQIQIACNSVQNLTAKKNKRERLEAMRDELFDLFKNTPPRYRQPSTLARVPALREMYMNVGLDEWFTVPKVFMVKSFCAIADFGDAYKLYYTCYIQAVTHFVLAKKSPGAMQHSYVFVVVSKDGSEKKITTSFAYLPPSKNKVPETARAPTLNNLFLGCKERPGFDNETQQKSISGLINSVYDAVVGDSRKDTMPVEQKGYYVSGLLKSFLRMSRRSGDYDGTYVKPIRRYYEDERVSLKF